ncbi:MAG: pirin family protein [Actinobacteria bacterium]|nr:pirin family protein [Actinomycetota bacterium]MCG2803127.1 pirin family protein [Cellulomonas sp.]
MTNLERHPAETVCGPGDPDGIGRVQVLTPRDVPLGGIRAMTVRRTLPQRARSFIGAWCFLDHYGPDDVSVTGGMVVPPHPHTGLATVSWLFSGQIEHRDSLGTHALVRPGELNLMTAGRGIVHSEYSTPGTTVLHGAQLWVALPDADRDTAPAFAHHAPAPHALPGATVRVFLGSLAGVASPVPWFTPLLGAELVLDPDARLTLDVDPGFEHGVLLDAGDVAVAGTVGRPGELLYVAPGESTLTLAAGSTGARVLLLGGTPLGERIVMWWNFVGRSHEDVVAARAAWQGGIGEEADRVAAAPGRFPPVPDDPHAPLRAPVLPPIRLVPRS